ncbi:MAG: hypothetical protein B6D61_12505 [Bacteroidetes bacterium 4484_249]|nr:MAG: hypothetical protein B6D61_12505 [Bacteroidetes bacterium 4484_249]
MNEKEFLIYLGTRSQDRLRIHFMSNKGKILNLLIQYEGIINNKWIAIVRYDCAHGFFHRDIINPDGSQEKKAIEMDNLNIAFSFARQDLEDKWEWYKEQFIKKLKV